MSGLVIFNAQAEQTVPDDLPILAIVHDDQPNPLAAFAGKNVWAYRCMSPYSQAYHQFPIGSRAIFWNEADFEQNTSRWVDYLNQVKADRPDIVLIYGASNTAYWPNGGEWPVDPTLKSQCYFFAIHIPTFATASQCTALLAGWTNPWCVTEVEADPLNPAYQDPASGPPALRADLMAGAKAALAAGAQVAALWGQSPNRADALDDIELIAQVRAFNAQQGGIEVVDPNDPVIVGLKKQIADFTEGMRRVVEGKYNGPTGAAAIVVALEGGSDPSLKPQPDIAVP